MNRINWAFVCFSALCFFSCGSRSSVVSDASIRIVNPGFEASLSPDTTFHVGIEGVSNCVDVQIVEDSILVVQGQTNGDDLFHFKAYSTKSMRFLGSFVPKGRGPGELISPHLVKTSPESTWLVLSDNASGFRYRVNVQESISLEKQSFSPCLSIAANLVDWIPLSDSVHLVLSPEQKEFVFHLLDENGTVLKTFHPYKGIDAERAAPLLSGLITSNEQQGKVFVSMVCFPQFFYLNCMTGSIQSFAVNKAFRGWKNTLNRAMDMESIQYYSGVASSSDYVFASYWGCSLEKVLKGNHGARIHVFDWAGNFIYAFDVKEDIGPMAIDPQSKHLYCVDVSKGSVVRYDLSNLLQ